MVNLNWVCEKLIIFLLLILIFLPPTFLLGGFTFYSLTLIETLVLLACLIWFSGRIKIIKSKINLVVLCYTLACLLSLINSTYLRGSWEDIIKLICCLLFFLLIRNFSAGRLKLFIHTFIFTTLVVIFLSWLYLFTHLPESLSDRFFYPLGNPNLLAGFLVITIPLMIRILFIVRFRFLLGILLFFSFMTLYFTYSKGAVLGIMGAILFLFFINRQNRYVKYIFVVLMLGLLIVLVIAYKCGFLSPWGILAGSASSRLYIWKYSWQMFLDHPLCGVGLGVYPNVYFEYKQNPPWHLHSHNIFMQHACEVGIIGLLSFIWLLVTLFKENFNQVLSCNYEQAIKEGLLASLIGFLSHGQVDYVSCLFVFQLYFWLIIGLLSSIREKEREKKKQTPNTKYQIAGDYIYLSSFLSWFMNIIIFLFWFFCIFRPYLGYVSFNQGVCLADKGRWEEAKIKFEKAILFDFSHPIYYAHLGTTYTKIRPADLVSAIKANETAVQFDRYNPQIYRNLGWLYYQKGIFQLAEKAWSRASKLQTGEKKKFIPLYSKTPQLKSKKEETLCWKLYRRIPMRELDIYSSSGK